MKKLLLVVAVALIAFNVSAQDVNFGVKAGVNFASIGGDDTGDLSSLTSFHAGVVAEIPLSDKFSFQPELVYSAQGATLDADGDVDIKLDYINVPLLAKFYVADNFSLYAGPQIGFLASAKVEDEDIKDSVKSIDFGINLGLGYKMESGLNFAAGYNLGLSDINDDSEESGSNQNGVFQVSVGYFFN